jgi:hypothetical protein
MAMTPDKMYRPEISGPKGRPVTPSPERLARMQARKERMLARATQRAQAVQIKPIANKEVNPVYRNQGFK